MAKITLPLVTNIAFISQINANFQALATELQNKVYYRTNPVGETNTVNNTLDMNGNRLFNLPVPTDGSEPVRLIDITSGFLGSAASLAFALAAPGGSSLVGFIQSGTGAINQTLQTKIRRTRIDVTDFGAVGDGVTDDTLAINRAITAAGSKRDLYFPIPSVAYNITSALTQLTGQKWIGEGGKRSAVIKKMANMTQMVTTGDLGTIENLTFDGNGASFTGRGIFVAAGNDIKIERVRVTQTQGIALEFTDEAGAGCRITDFYGDTTNPTVVPAVKLGASATNAFPKFFDGLWLSGGLIDLTSNTAGRDVCITNFFIRNILTSAQTGRVYISNGRVASIADTTTLKGAQLTISNTAFSGPVVIDAATGLRLSNNIYGSGITEINQAAGNGNQYTSRLNTFTPTWTQASGTQPVIGNGTLLGWYTKNGDTCTVTIQLTAGSTTTFGNNLTGYLFSLPFLASTQLNQRIIGADILDASPAANYIPYITIAAGTQSFKLSTTQDVRDTFPITWANGDIIRAQFTYYTA